MSLTLRFGTSFACIGNERDERDILRLEGVHSYQSSSFGSETSLKLTKKYPADQKGLEEDY